MISSRLARRHAGAWSEAGPNCKPEAQGEQSHAAGIARGHDELTAAPGATIILKTLAARAVRRGDRVADCAALEMPCGGQTSPRVQIPPSPLPFPFVRGTFTRLQSGVLFSPLP